MGLKLTLPKENNFLYTDFTDAYWAVDEINYDSEGNMTFALNAYASREAKYKDMATDVESLGVGGSYRPYFETKLYMWQGSARIEDIFPEGIPLSHDAQLTAIYNWIKAYTELPFEDVLEDSSSWANY